LRKSMGVREIPGHDARVTFSEGEWFLLSAGGRRGEILRVLFDSGISRSDTEGFNLLVRVTRED